jgi:hypothetical protein
LRDVRAERGYTQCSCVGSKDILSSFSSGRGVAL